MAGTLNEQERPSALLPDLPAAKAALDAVMQNTSSAAATISMVSLMVRPSQLRDFGCGKPILAPKRIGAERNKFGPVLA